jgi:hypothetical protein
MEEHVAEEASAQRQDAKMLYLFTNTAPTLRLNIPFYSVPFNEISLFLFRSTRKRPQESGLSQSPEAAGSKKARENDKGKGKR